MSSLTSLRLFYPKLSQFSFKPSNPLFSSFSFSSPISFQRLSNPSSHNHLHPIKSQQQSETPTINPTLLPFKLQEIIALFQSVTDPKSKYQQLLHYSSQLPPLDTQFKTDAYRVRGCVSQVWVRAFADPDDPFKVRFEADSDSQLTKGLAALLVFGLSGSSAGEISAVPPEFVQLLGLRQSLTPSRNNGFLNMLRLMQDKAVEISGLEIGGLGLSRQDRILDGGDEDSNGKNNGYGGNLGLDEFSSAKVQIAEIGGTESNGQDRILNGENQNLGGNNNGSGRNLDLDEVLSANGSRVSVLEGKGESFDVNGGEKGSDSVINGDLGGGFGGRSERIRERLEKELSPAELEVEDISHLHAGHAGVRGSSGGETHFNLRVVSKEFEGKSMVKRHRLVYGLLREELENGLHALSIDAKAPSEIQSS